jgi:hypothetical protein
MWNKPLCVAALLGLLLAATAGCKGSGGVKDFDFDSHGWGGPNLTYRFDAAAKIIRIDSGMLVNRDFRWAESQFSFEFLDTRDLVWGFRLLDVVFSPMRHEALRTTRVKIGEREFVPGRNLPPGQMWKFDTVLDVEFRPETSGGTYKVLDGVWYESIMDNGKFGVRVTAPHAARIKQNAWNTFSARIVRGKLEYQINGEPGQGTFQIDARTNGRLGMFVQAGGPLLIRNVRLGAQSGP